MSYNNSHSYAGLICLHPTVDVAVAAINVAVSGLKPAAKTLELFLSSLCSPYVVLGKILVFKTSLITQYNYNVMTAS